MSALGEGGAQQGTGFAAGSERDSGDPFQGMSSADISALQAAGVSVAGPGDRLSSSEAFTMRPQSMGGTGVGGADRALTASVEQAQQKSTPRFQPSAPQADSASSVLNPVNSLAEMIAAMTGGGGGGMSALQSATPSAGGGGGGMGGMNIGSMAGSFAGGMADGGELAPGQTALVGEEGPEMLTADAQGGATVTPFRAAKPIVPSAGARAARLIGEAMMGLGGPTGAAAITNRRAARADAQQKLATAAIQNPVLLRTSGSAVAAVDAMFGAGTADALARQGDPNMQAKAMAQLMGVDLVPPGTKFEDGTVAPTEMKQLQGALDQFGIGVSFTSKGEMRVTQPARSREDQDAIVAQGFFTELQKVFRAQGLNDVQANKAAATRGAELLGARNIAVPEWMRKYQMADSDAALAAAKAEQTAAAKGRVQLGLAGPLAAAGERGRRAERINDPISADEIQVRGGKIASAMGGVAYGRDLTEDDLMAADEQNFVFKQQPDGSYIGIPKDKIAEDAAVLYPSEMLTKKLARKMAAKQTTQQQNARIVIDSLNRVDDIDALSLLTEAAPQGASLGEQLAGAIQTEFAGQTTGRATVWSARRSPQDDVRQKAIALINLKSLSTSVVKALGDVGAISEADKAIIYERFARIANGTASRQEAATQLQELRQMMVALQAAGNITKGSDKANSLKEDISLIVGKKGGSVHTPPRGYNVVPGTGLFYTIEP